MYNLFRRREKGHVFSETVVLPDTHGTAILEADTLEDAQLMSPDRQKVLDRGKLSYSKGIDKGHATRVLLYSSPKYPQIIVTEEMCTAG